MEYRRTFPSCRGQGWDSDSGGAPERGPRHPGSDSVSGCQESILQTLQKFPMRAPRPGSENTSHSAAPSNACSLVKPPSAQLFQRACACHSATGCP